VETVFVFDRHAATDLSVAYGILVPERATRPIPASAPVGPTPTAGQEGRLADDQRQQPQQHCDQRPGRRQRMRPAGREGQLEFDLQFGPELAGAVDGRDLRAGVLDAAAEGRDDRIPDRGAG
jgi:hypothetical protein